MAYFEVAGEGYTSDRKDYKLRCMPAKSMKELEADFNYMLWLERCHNNGNLKCKQQDWEEIVAIAQDIRFEIDVRRLFGECGLYLEVR